MVQIDYNAVMFSKNIEEYKTMFRKEKVYGNLSFEDNSIIKNLDFGKTYYMFFKDKLVAFKIRAFSVIKDKYFIQTPNNVMWVNLRNYRLFNTKEEYFLYLEGKCNPIVLETTLIDLCNIPTIVNRWNHSMELRNCYKWDKGLGKPIKNTSYLYDVLFVGNGFVIYYELFEGSFDTYEQCVKANLNGMNVEDFDEEDGIPTFTITIKAEIKPKIHTLRFIES